MVAQNLFRVAQSVRKDDENPRRQSISKEEAVRNY